MINQQCLSPPVLYFQNSSNVNNNTLNQNDKMSRKRKSADSICFLHSNYLNLNNTHLDSEGSTQISNQLFNNQMKFIENSDRLSEYKRPSFAISNTYAYSPEISHLKCNGTIISKYKEINNSKLKNNKCLFDPNQFLIKINSNIEGKTNTHLILEESIDQNMFSSSQKYMNEKKILISNNKGILHNNESRRMMIELIKCFNRNSNSQENFWNVIKDFTLNKNEISPTNNIIKSNIEINFNESCCSFRNNTFDHNDPSNISEENVDEPTKLLSLLIIPKIVVITNTKQLMSITPLISTFFNNRDSFVVIFKSIDTLKTIQKIYSSMITECNVINYQHFNLQFIDKNTFRKVNLKIKINNEDECEEFVNGIKALLNERGAFC